MYNTSIAIEQWNNQRLWSGKFGTPMVSSLIKVFSVNQKIVSIHPSIVVEQIEWAISDAFNA